MKLTEREVRIRAPKDGRIFDQLGEWLRGSLTTSEQPVRFAVSRSDANLWNCELGILSDDVGVDRSAPIFDFRRRAYEATDAFTTAFLVPTGVGAEIGGHAGDATPAVRLLAQNSDRIVLHPNVVNASDINELPANSLYVEGSILTRLLMGTIGLQPVRSNRVLVVVDDHPDAHFVDAAINTVSAARATYGLNCAGVIKLSPPVQMWAEYTHSGRAAGTVNGLSHCLDVIEHAREEWDAVAFSSVIRVPQNYHADYFTADGTMVNPWGGVEAMFTHAVSSILDVPAAHAPMFEAREIENLDVGVVEPRMAAEAVSVSFLQCVLKGLHTAPRIIRDQTLFGRRGIVSAEDISCLVIPDGCLGLPTLAALEQGIPVIAVRENANLMHNDLDVLPWHDGQFHRVENYLEAAGAISSIKAGVTIESVRRPLSRTSTWRNDAIESIELDAPKGARRIGE